MRRLQGFVQIRISPCPVEILMKGERLRLDLNLWNNGLHNSVVLSAASQELSTADRKSAGAQLLYRISPLFICFNEQHGVHLPCTKVTFPFWDSYEGFLKEKGKEKKCRHKG